MRARRLTPTLVIVTCFAGGCDDGSAPPGAVPVVAAPSPTFVGRQACVECHEREAGLFAGSHHDLAMDVATPSTVLGDFDDASFTHFGVTSTFFTRGGGYFVRTDGPDGAMTEYPIASVFGFDPLQQYLIEMPDGRVQCLGVSWDSRPETDGGQRWFHLYPDEPVDHRDPLHWTRPQQNWNHMCAECHSTNLVKGYDLDADRFDTGFEEIDVSCEACHGAGSRHVAWAQQYELDGDTETDPTMGLVVNLRVPSESIWQFNEHVPTAQRTEPIDSTITIDRCGRCHSRRGQFWPNERHDRPLTDTHRVALLEDGLYHDDGQILDEVYVYGSFLQSKMHRKGVTCMDCHEPHSAQLKADGNTLCGQCHKPEVFDVPEHHHHEPGTPGAGCVDCHMAVRTYMVVDPRHDHSFRIPRPDLSVKLGTPNTCTDCHADQSVVWAHEAATEWYGELRPNELHYGEAFHASRQGRPGAEALLLRVFDNHEFPDIARATALLELERFPSPDLVAAIERGAADESALVRRTAAEMLDFIEPTRRLALGLTLVEDPMRSVRLAAVPPIAAAPADALTAPQQAALNGAMDEYMAAQMMNADRSETHLNLGNLASRMGRVGTAESAYRTSVAIDPSFVPGTVNLADLLRRTGREEESVEVLKAAIAVNPTSATLHHALGLALVRSGAPTEALSHLEIAATLAPQSARYALVHAVALHDLGGTEAAINVLRDAFSRVPPDRDILFALINYSHERGRPGEALAWAREAAALWPDDPGVLQMLRALED